MLTAPATTSGTRASSIRMESASSTSAMWKGRCTSSADVPDQVVAQVIEAGLLRRHVGHVGAIGLLPLRTRHALLHERHRQAEPLIERRHPLGVAPRQVVVEGEDVDAAAGERVERRRHHRRQRLALAGLHLDDRALVHGESGDDLLVEGPHAEEVARQLARQREELGSQRRQRLAGRRAVAHAPGASAQFRHGQGRHLRTERADLAERRVVATQVEQHRRAAQPRQPVTPPDGVAEHSGRVTRATCDVQRATCENVRRAACDVRRAVRRAARAAPPRAAHVAPGTPHIAPGTAHRTSSVAREHVHPARCTQHVSAAAHLTAAAEGATNFAEVL